MSVRVRHFGFDLLPEAVADMDALPDDVRAEALDALNKVVLGRVRGHPLGGRRGQPLEACRRLYLGEAQWRVVYLETPGQRGAVGLRGLVVVAAGPRAGGAVYATAGERLQALYAAADAATAPGIANPAASAARMRPGQPGRRDLPPEATRSGRRQAVPAPSRTTGSRPLAEHPGGSPGNPYPTTRTP